MEQKEALGTFHVEPAPGRILGKLILLSTFFTALSPDGDLSSHDAFWPPSPSLS